jgi:hypothetical protein
MNALIDMLHNNDVLLGFASVEIKYAYLGSLFATLLCVIYGLITWNMGRKAARVRRPAKTIQVKQQRPSRRRPAKTVRVKKTRQSRRRRQR